MLVSSSPFLVAEAALAPNIHSFSALVSSNFSTTAALGVLIREQAHEASLAAWCHACVFLVKPWNISDTWLL